MRILDNEQDAYLRSIVPGRSTKEYQELLNSKFGTNLSIQQIKSYKNNHHLSSGLTGYFPKGHAPVNKGTKGKYNVGGNRTSFKKGQLPHNTDPIGTEKLLADGYIYVKIKDTPNARKLDNWKQKHRLIWEQANGPIPEGYKLLFLDGDRTHIKLDNLTLISKSESLIMNKQGLNYGDADCTKAGIAVAKVMDATYKAKRRKRR